MNAYALGYIPLKNSCMMLLYLASQPPIYPQYGGSALMQPVARSIASSIATPFRSVGASSSFSSSDRYMVAAIALGSCALGAAVTWWWLDPRGVAKRHKRNEQEIRCLQEGNRKFIDGLQRTIKGLQSSLQQAEQNYLSFDMQLKILQTENDHLHNQVELLENDNTAAERDCTRYVSEICALNNQVSSLREKHNRLGSRNRILVQLCSSSINHTERLTLVCSNLWREVLTYRIYPNPQYAIQLYLIKGGSTSDMRLLSSYAWVSPECFVTTSGVRIVLMATSNTRMVFDRSDVYPLNCNLIALTRWCMQRIEEYKCESEELNNLYAKQTTEHQQLIQDYRTLTQSLEQRVKKLEAIVTSFPERITALESKQQEQMRAISKQIVSLLKANCITVRREMINTNVRHNDCLQQIISVLGKEDHTLDTLLAALSAITSTIQSNYLSPTESSRRKSSSTPGSPLSSGLPSVSRSPLRDSGALSRCLSFSSGATTPIKPS